MGEYRFKFCRKLAHESQNQRSGASAHTLSVALVGHFATKIDPALPCFLTNLGEIFGKPLICSLMWAKKFFGSLTSSHIYLPSHRWVVLPPGPPKFWPNRARNQPPKIWWGPHNFFLPKTAPSTVQLCFSVFRPEFLSVPKAVLGQNGLKPL